jgi:hypothetical protein
MRTMQRIDPEEAEEFDAETLTLLTRWAARRLDVGEEQVARVLVEVTGGCGEGTCEFTTARAEVDLTDGRVFLGPDQGFGLFIQDIVESAVNPDGTTRDRYFASEMWDLYDEDGKLFPAKPKPAPRPSPRPLLPPEPMPGVSFRVEQRNDPDGRIIDRRAEVYTAHGWVNLREVVAAYDAEHGSPQESP